MSAGQRCLVVRKPQKILGAGKRSSSHAQGHGGWPKAVRFPHPNTPISVYIYSHAISGPISPIEGPRMVSCWTYISQGLPQVDQREVVFTLRQRENENEELDIPWAPVYWILAVFDLASGGLHLRTGQMCDLISEGMCSGDGGNSNFILHAKLKQFNFDLALPPDAWECMRPFGMLLHGVHPLGYGIPDLPAGALPPRAHHVIALTHEEADVARQFGCMRVVGRLAHSTQRYPFPPWIDRDRADYVTMAHQSGSFRVGLRVARICGLNAITAGSNIVLTVPRDEKVRELFRAHALAGPPSEVVSFESFMDEWAESLLIWTGTGTNTNACFTRDCESISPMMWRTSLAFICLAPGGTRDECILVEDGSAGTWQSIRHAVKNTRDITVALGHGRCFLLSWEKSVYRSPVDGAEYEADVMTHHRRTLLDGTALLPNSHAQLNDIVFLINPPGTHVDMEDFLPYLRQIAAAVEESIPVTPIAVPTYNNTGGTLGRNIIVEVELPKCAGWLKAFVIPSANGLPVQLTLERIASLTQPRRLSKIKFQMEFALWGYDGPSTISECFS